MHCLYCNKNATEHDENCPHQEIIGSEIMENWSGGYQDGRRGLIARKLDKHYLLGYKIGMINRERCEQQLPETFDIDN